MRIRVPLAILAVFLSGLVAACGRASTPATSVQTRDVSYEHNGTKLQGLLAWNPTIEGKRPGVLVVHEWWGHDEHARNQAKRLAESGYVALALDMYGDGKHATHPDDAQKFSMEATKDLAVVMARFNAARDLLMADPHVEPSRIAAIGYCFGGSIVLGMARAGADLDAVVSFHGVLTPQAPARAGEVRSSILVMTGGDDPFVPAEQVEAFRQEMRDAKADFRVITYPGVKHSFTNPQAESHGMPQLGYNAEADRNSWKEMLTFFGRVIG